MRYVFTLLLAGTLYPAWLCAGPTEEVVVTAEFRKTTELLTAHSIAVLDANAIEARAASHLEDVVGMVPNLTFAGGTGRARFFQIRGIGERSQFADPINPSVGILIDNVDFSGTGSGATLLDVDQVEVLRGPQGTRYGAGALAGLINIKTMDPGDQAEASLSVSAAEFATSTVSGFFSTPLFKGVGIRVAGQQHRSDGYTYNAYLGRDDVNYRDETTLRGKLTYGGDNIDLGLTLLHVDVDNGYDTFSLDNTRITLSDEPGHDQQRSNAISLQGLWRMDRLDLQVIGAAANSGMSYGYDEDWSFVGIHPDAYSATDLYQRSKQMRSLELRLLSNDNSRMLSDSTDWLLGLYVIDAAESMTRTYTFLPAPFLADFSFTNIAAFVSLQTDLTESLQLDYGLRVENRQSNYLDDAQVQFEPTETLWGGSVSLKYFTPGNTLLYASLSRGYKAGGFNTDGALDADLRQFDSEFLWEFESGIKGLFLQQRLGLRAAAFYSIRRDQQVKSSLVRSRPDGSTEFIDFLGNAAEGTNTGAELETTFQATDMMGLRLGLGLLRARFDSFVNEFGEDLSGRDQAQAPRWSASAGMNFRQGHWFGELNADARDAFFFSDRHDVKSDRYLLLNARLGYRTDHFTLSLWGRNLTDKDTFVRGFGSFGNDPRKGYQTEPYRQFGEPRVIGVTLDVTFQGGH
ncbi:MAG: TonB-dependent receptor [Pseudomonadota bacterium]